MIEPSLELRPLRASDSEMPLKQVVLHKNKERERQMEGEGGRGAARTSRGWAKYMKVGSRSSMASLISLFTAAAAGDEGKLNSEVSFLGLTWAPRVVPLLHYSSLFFCSLGSCVSNTAFNVVVGAKLRRTDDAHTSNWTISRAAKFAAFFERQRNTAWSI